MADKKYDSELIGYTDDPVYNDAGELMSWRVKIPKMELETILEKYLTSVNEKGQGANAYVTLFMSKAGKACARVYNPNSEAAQEYRNSKKQQSTASVADDLPF
jgi:hypothetical protein